MGRLMLVSVSPACVFLLLPLSFCFELLPSLFNFARRPGCWEWKGRRRWWNWLADTTSSPLLLLLLSFASVFTDCFRVPIASEMLKELRRWWRRWLDLFWLIYGFFLLFFTEQRQWLLLCFLLLFFVNLFSLDFCSGYFSSVFWVSVFSSVSPWVFFPPCSLVQLRLYRTWWVGNGW